jgi:hypothetical protein
MLKCSTRRNHLQQILAVLGGSVLPGKVWAQFSQGDALSGVKAALERGAEAAVAVLGQDGGFLDNPKVHIPLPGVLNDAAKVLKAMGQQKKVDELVTAMNRAAEAAVPEANMGVDDARQLIRGGDDSVTRFFADKTRAPLAEKFLPIVTKHVERLAVAQKYNSMASRAAGLGLLKAQDANVQQYVTGRALDGLYLMIAEEERKIRQDPVGTGSAILKKVFGGLK